MASRVVTIGGQKRKVQIRKADNTGYLPWVGTVSGDQFTVHYNETTAIGVWTTGVDELYTSSTGAAREFTFTGTHFSIYATRDAHHGIARLVIDGVHYQVDLYAASRAENVLVYSSATLADQAHAIRWECNGTKNAASSGMTITLGSAVVTSTAGDPYPGDPPVVQVRTLVDLDFTTMANDSTYVSSASNSNAARPLFLESGRATVGISNGALRKTDGATYHRLWTKEMAGGVGTKVRIELTAATDLLPSTSGSVPGLKVGTYMPPLNHPDRTNPASPYDGDVEGDPYPVSSVQVYTGQNGEGGRIEISNQVRLTGYRFSYQNGVPAKFVPYTDNTKMSMVVEIEQFSATHIRSRLWHNAAGTGTPVYEWDDPGYTIGDLDGFIRIRTDDANWVIERLKITETAIAQPVLWQPDLAQGLAALDYTVSATGAGCGATTPVVAGSPDPSGRVLRHTIAAGISHDGVKGRKWLDEAGVAARDEIYGTVNLYVPAGADIVAPNSTTSKQAWGVGGHPRNGNIWEVSAGGSKRPDSWSVRICTFPENYPNYKGNVHPATLLMYLYAKSADGRTLQEFGIEVPFRKPDGTWYALQRGTWLPITYRVKVNTDGVADGIVQAWLGDEQWVNVTDVVFNDTGQRQKINALISETFHNTARSATVAYDYAGLSLRAGQPDLQSVAPTYRQRETFATGTGGWTVESNASNLRRVTGKDSDGAIAWDATATGNARSKGPVFPASPGDTVNLTMAAGHSDTVTRSALLQVYETTADGGYLNVVSSTLVSLPAGPLTTVTATLTGTHPSTAGMRALLSVYALPAGATAYLGDVIVE